MENFNGSEKVTEKDDKVNLNYDSLIKKIAENGDLVILGKKEHVKPLC